MGDIELNNMLLNQFLLFLFTFLMWLSENLKLHLCFMSYFYWPSMVEVICVLADIAGWPTQHLILSLFHTAKAKAQY